jgi:hypothetical protein
MGSGSDYSDTSRNNTTDYAHPQETNLLNVHKAMEYNAAGEPVLRVNNAGAVVYNNSGNISGTSDAFGRLRISQPLTLFDSSHRYKDNNLFAESTSGGGSSSFNTNAGLIEMDVGTASGDEVLRESTKTMSYQPGKSMLIMNTFVFNEAKTNLRQRVGYFGSENGLFLELDNDDLCFVERSSVTGSVTETKIPQSQWNVDKLDGSAGAGNVSGITLDITKAQILWMDIEWLGLGSARMGFVINGQFVVAHVFHHANLIDSTYITTASLPLRQEITNTGTTTSASKSKQVCSTVISEGGYELRGLQQAVGTPIATPYDLALADTYYPIISIRLKTSPDRLDAIVIQTALSIVGLSNNANYNWRVVASGTTTGGSWVSAGVDSAVEYNITGTSFTGGRILASGWFQGSNQGSSTIDILKEALFKFQLERDTFTSTPFELTLIIAGDSAGSDVYASMDWEEVSR